MDFENKLSLVHAGARVPNGLPSAAVPDDYGARAVLPWRNGAFEPAIVNGMVFHMNRHPFLSRVVAWSLRNGPAQQDPIELES
jgi:hypothetical protein